MKLIDQTLRAKEALEKSKEDLNSFIQFLHCPKFNSPEDWIRTPEVVQRLREIRNEIEYCLNELTVTKKESKDIKVKIVGPGWYNGQIGILNNTSPTFGYYSISIGDESDLVFKAEEFERI